MIQESLSWTDGAALPHFSPEGSKETPCSSANQLVPTMETAGQNPQALAGRSSDDGEVGDASRMEVGTAAVHASATPNIDSGREGYPTVDHDLYDDPNADRVDDIHDFCSAIFKSVPEPLLLRPTSPSKRVCSKRTGRKRKNMVATPLEHAPRGAPIIGVGG